MLDISINGNVVSQEPDGVKDLTERLYYSTELGGYLTEVTGTVVFYGDEYEYLRELMDGQMCDAVSLIISDRGALVPIFNGKMFLTDMIWHPDKSMVEAEVLDDGYLSAIDGNREIEAEINVNKSKNGVIITSLALSGLQFWNETRGISYTNRSGMRVGDALEFFVDFMTDGQVGFVSDFFNTNATTHPQYFDMICTGLTMRDGSSDYPRISFDSLFKDLQKLYNLSFAVERTAAGVHMRVEPREYFYGTTTGESFLDILHPTQTIRRDSFYSKVTFGSAQVSNDFTYYPNIPFSGVLQENYHLGGECNINTQLPLQLSTLITDPNIIQDVLPSGSANEGYDDEVFLVRFDSLNSSYGTMTLKPGSATDYYYNEAYSNYRVAERWFNQIPESIFSFLGSGNDEAFATQTANPQKYHDSLPLDPSYIVSNFLVCDDDVNPPNEDPSNNYQVGALTAGGLGFHFTGQAGYYTAPINGMYNVTADFYVTGYFPTKAALVRIDSANNIVEFPWEETAFTGTFTISTADQLTHNHTFFMNAGDKVAFAWEAPVNIEIWNATFKVLDPLGGEWVTGDPKSVRLLETSFDYDISQDKWNTIQDDPFKSFYADYKTGSVNGWISEIERDRLTGKSSVKLLSKP